MNVFKNGLLAMMFVFMFFLGIGFFGCATTSQIKVLEEKTQRASDSADKALRECQSAKAAVEDSSKFSAEANVSAQRAEKAVLRCEKAAERAEEAATLATGYARRAEEMAKRCEDIFEQISAK